MAGYSAVTSGNSHFLLLNKFKVVINKSKKIDIAPINP